MKKKIVRHKMVDTTTEEVMPAMAAPALSNKKRMYMMIGIAVLTFLVLNKSLFVAAMVNGRPIFRWELNRAMTDRFGKQTLEGMITERLIASEAKKAGVSVTKEEAQVKTDALVASLGGGMTIDQLLSYQGLTRADFDSQLILQMTVEKLLGKDVTVTDIEVTNFLATSSALLSATDEAALKEEARQAIMSERINAKLAPWFAEIKEKASVFRFLK